MAERAFTKEGVSLILRMSAEHHTGKEIWQHFEKENLPRPAHQNRIYEILRAKCHQKELEMYREEYYSRVKDVKISHKRTRLEIIQKTLDALERTFDKMLNAEGGIKTTSLKKCSQLISRVDNMLSRAQDEMEKRPGTLVALTQHFTSKGVTDEELLVEERKIVARIAELRGRGVSLPAHREEGPPAPEAPKD